MPRFKSQAPSALPIDDYNDETTDGGPVDASQEAIDSPQIRNSEVERRKVDEQDLAGRSDHRRRLFHGRGNLQHGRHAAARKRPGPPASEPPIDDYANRQLQPFVREPGGKFDSFNSLPSGTDGSDLVAKLVLYAHNQVYSHFFVGEAKDTSILPYTNYALHYDHAYWGAAWFSCTSRRWLAGQSIQHTPQELFYYSRSLESLRQALNDPALATHESTISTILHLSFPPYLPDFDRSIPRPRQSNFKTWNLLHLATGLNVAEEHMLGLSTIVKMLGGVHNIQSAQIRRSVCFQGIHFSGRHLKAPLFPFASLHPVEQLVRGSRLVRPRRIFEPPTDKLGFSRGTGFHEISFPEVPKNIPQPAVVWAYLADMTTILEDYASGGSMRSQSSLILDQMQFTQHSLLSLPPAADLKRQKQDEGEDSNMATISVPQSQLQIYEITRWACICYANLVTYPTDYSTFPRLRLVKLLRRQLETAYDTDMIEQFSIQEIRLLFWATVVGAIMAVGLEAERAAFVALVAHSAADARVWSWIEAKQVMESFLWHSQTSDADALKLWIEVQKLGARGMGESRLPERTVTSKPHV